MHLRPIGYSAQAQQHFEWNFGAKPDFCRWKLLNYARYYAKDLGIDDIAYYQLERMLDQVRKGIDRIIITTVELMSLTGRERDRVFKSNRMLMDGGLIEKIPRRGKISGVTRVMANGYRFIMPPQALTDIKSSLRPKPSRAELGMAIEDFRSDPAARPGYPYGEHGKGVLAGRPESAKSIPTAQNLNVSMPHENSADPHHGDSGSDRGADHDPAPEAPTGWPDLVKRPASVTRSEPIPVMKEPTVSASAAPCPVPLRAERRLPDTSGTGGAKTANEGFERISVVSREKRDFSADRQRYFARREEEKKALEAKRLAALSSKLATAEIGPAIRSEPVLERAGTNQLRCSLRDQPLVGMEQAREGEGASGSEPDRAALSGGASAEPDW